MKKLNKVKSVVSVMFDTLPTHINALLHDNIDIDMRNWGKAVMYIFKKKEKGIKRSMSAALTSFTIEELDWLETWAKTPLDTIFLENNLDASKIKLLEDLGKKLNPLMVRINIKTISQLALMEHIQEEFKSDMTFKQGTDWLDSEVLAR